MWKAFGIGGVTLLIACSAAWTDSITINGTRHDNVYVRESDSRYYVQFPKDGSVISLWKSDIKPGDCIISQDGNLREALLKEWEANYARRQPATKKKHTHKTGLSPENPAPPRLSPRAGAPFTISPSPTENRPLETARTAPVSNKITDGQKGIRERSSLNVDGVPKLVLRGRDKKDPARDQYRLEFTLAERARAEEEALRQAREEQAYWDRLALELDTQESPVEEYFPPYDDIPEALRIPEYHPAEPDIPDYEFEFAPQPWQEPDQPPRIPQAEQPVPEHDNVTSPPVRDNRSENATNR